ncbi:MAG: helix-turn-helix domain-containing protein [Gemmataceae bacterium]
MIRIHLPDGERQALEVAFRSTDDRKLRYRLQVVLMAARGGRPAEIAEALGVSTRTVPRWLNAYLVGGLAGLPPRKAEGARPKIPASLADEVRGWVTGGPASCGLDRANWTYAELADHLKKTHGIDTSRSAVGRFCRKIGVRVYRPTYRFLRADPQKQGKAREELGALKWGHRPASSSC